jgi:hypothetical protein
VRYLPIALLLCACGGAPAERLATPVVAAGQPSATLTVQRTTALWGAALVYEIDVDNRPVANLGPGKGTSFAVPAGPHVIDVMCGAGPFGASSQVALVAEAGRAYRVETWATLGSGCVARVVG